MHFSETANAISEFNLSYLLLARRLIIEDEAEAMFRLGLSQEGARLVGGLGPAQLIKLSRTTMLLCGFCLDDRALLATLASATSQRDQRQMHSTIHSAQDVETSN